MAVENGKGRGGAHGDWRLEPVEKRILPLVRALNRGGSVRTLNSCEGHEDRRSRPFVAFTAPVGAASVVVRRVRALVDAGRLNFFWTLDGHFDGDGKLDWMLVSRPDDVNGAWAEFWHYTVRRRRRRRRERLDADIGVLARELGKAAARFARGSPADAEYLVPPPALVPEGIGLPARTAKRGKGAKDAG